MVEGMLRHVGNRIELSVSVIRAQNAKEILKTKIDFDRSPEIDKMESEALPAPDAGAAKKASASSGPAAGEKGYTAPVCLYCPNPRYSSRALRMHEQGEIVLDTVIGVDGRAHSLTILQGLSCGLNQQALDIIENVYRFRPANGPDGKPVAVRMLFKIEFRLF
ncbi:MAG: energy transducer TonB [Candidatus Acidiferrales bacterium]